MNNRKIEVPLDNFLEIISCAEDYWFDKSVLFWWIAEQIDTLSDAEIINYSNWLLLLDEDYEQEDVDVVREILFSFKEKFLKTY